MGDDHVLAFLLQGKVQGVKLRRYVEAAGRHCGVGGYVINTASGAVFGEAWGRVDDLRIWIRGEQSPAVYTNLKPTPVGTAYPEKAKVERFAVQRRTARIDRDLAKRFEQFTMIRDDQEAAELLSERNTTHDLLSSALLAGTNLDSCDEIEFGSWSRR